MEEALQTAVVLETIFELLPYKDLKNVRRVNPLWNKIAIPIVRKRSAPIHVNHDLGNFVKFYKFQLRCKNLEIGANIPMSVHVRNGAKSDWRILKDLATYEPWKNRVTTLVLSDFWAVDLNRFLPWLLANLPNLVNLHLFSLNNEIMFGKSVIPEDYDIPVVAKTVEYSVKSLTLNWVGYRPGCRHESMILDPQMFAQCTSLKEFIVEVKHAPYHVAEFFKRIEKLDPNSFFTSIEHVKLTFIHYRSEGCYNPLMNALAHFVNRVKPTSFSLDVSCNFFLLEYCERFTTRIQNLAIDVPEMEDQPCGAKWIFNDIVQGTSGAFSNVQVVQLHPNHLAVVEAKVTPWSFDVNHRLTNVTTLQLRLDGFDLVDGEKLKLVLQEASVYLPNVQRVDIFELTAFAVNGEKMLKIETLSGLFEGMKDFEKLQKVSLQLVDFAGELVGRGQQIMAYGKDGIFSAGLSLLKGSALQEVSVSVRLDYDLPVDSLLFLFFAGYTPNVKLDLHLMQKTAGHVNLHLSKEEFGQALGATKPVFLDMCLDKLPGYNDLRQGMPRFTRMTNYKPLLLYLVRV